MQYKKIKTITSYTQQYRFLSETNYMDNSLDTIPRIKEILSPYAHSLEHVVYWHPKHGRIIMVETSHKRFEVFKLY